MSVVLVILLLCIVQFAAGFGVLTLFNIQLKPGLFASLAMLLGVAVFSVVPFILQLLYIPLTQLSVFSSLILVCVLLNMQIKKGKENLGKMFRGTWFKLSFYEIPFLAVIAVCVFVSLWRCFYLPPTPRDLTSGAEAIAAYAVREKTMINSVFTVNVESTNNVFKPPFIICLQLIYKMAGFAFGQLWLSIVFISFLVFLYQALCLTLHRLLAWFLLLCFIAIPEMFAYTFMVLFDYSNAVFFFLSVYFLLAFFKNSQTSYLFFAGVLMGIATYIRSETLVLACFMVPAILYNNLKAKRGMKKLLTEPILFLLPTVICYVLCVTVYLNHYLPVKYSVPDLVNPHLLDLAPFVTRFAEINSKLIFSQQGMNYYGYFIFIFLGLFVTEIVIKRRLNNTAKNWLYAVLVIYIGLAALGYLLPLMDLDNSTKRGMFKIFPLMLLCMANNSLLIQFSAWLTRITKEEQTGV